MVSTLFGPVTLAYVIEMRSHDLAPRLAWFGIAREGIPSRAGYRRLAIDDAFTRDDFYAYWP